MTIEHTASEGVTLEMKFALVAHRSGSTIRPPTSGALLADNLTTAISDKLHFNAEVDVLISLSSDPL